MTNTLTNSKDRPMTLIERQLQAAKALADLCPDLVELLPLPTCEDQTTPDPIVVEFIAAFTAHLTN